MREFLKEHGGWVVIVVALSACTPDHMLMEACGKACAISGQAMTKWSSADGCACAERKP